MAKPTSPPRRKALWCVREVMEQRGIMSVSALWRLLAAIGVTVSISNLGRLIDGKLQHWNQDVIEGLLTVLECNIEDILVTEIAKPRKQSSGIRPKSAR